MLFPDDILEPSRSDIIGMIHLRHRTLTGIGLDGDKQLAQNHLRMPEMNFIVKFVPHFKALNE